MIFDFHCHFTFKPLNSRSIYNKSGTLPDTELWRERFRPEKAYSKILLKVEKEVNFTSQVHLNSLNEGNVKCIVTSLYPLERVFTRPFETFSQSWLGTLLSLRNRIHPLYSVFRIRRWDDFFTLVSSLTGIDKDVVKSVYHGDYNYYTQLVKEYEYLVDNNNVAPAGYVKYEIAKNFDDIGRINREGKIAVIISVEGMNAFFDNTSKFDEHLDSDKNQTPENYLRIIRDNVKDFKSRDYPPFIITFAHHQYNLLCGHSPSFIELVKQILNQGGYTRTLDKNNKLKKTHFYDVGINDAGMEMVQLLLDRNEGKRILIDTKHMSPMARVKYHEYVKENAFRGDSIPIIQTHTGVNGRPSMRSASYKDGTLELSPKERKKHWFFTSSLNLFDDEIVEIVESDGLIGIMLDEKRIVGERLSPDVELIADFLPKEDDGKKLGNAFERFKYFKGKLKNVVTDWVLCRSRREELLIDYPDIHQRSDAIKNKFDLLEAETARYTSQVLELKRLLTNVFSSLLLSQFIHCVKVVDKASDNNSILANGKAWDHLCIGTDYEGVINPIDVYYYASDLKDLEKNLIIFWKNAINNPDPKFVDYKTYRFGRDVEELIKKILWNNAQEWLKRYFHNGYLK